MAKMKEKSQKHLTEVTLRACNHLNLVDRQYI